MAALNLFEQFVQDLALGVHDLDTHTFNVILTNVAPDAANDAVLADITEISAGNGYGAGGFDAQTALSRVGGTVTISGSNVTFTANGGAIGPFRYAVIYNGNPTSPLKPLVGYVDYGSEVTLADGESFLVDVETNDILTIS